MKWIVAALALGLLLAKAAPADAALPAAVRTEAGLVSGAAASDPAVRAFKGIPYAAPPVGALRWKAPQPPVKWAGVRKGDQYAAVCPFGPRAKPGQTQSEDCLFVNLWTSAQAANAKQPVMVWFHGAGDNSADALFDGTQLAKKGVVVVVVEYRVGVFGGLSTKELSAESGHNASSNYGLMDCIAALQWVQKNAAAFGGDPANVTLFGQSHGAGTQHFIAMSPLSKGLFGRVILQSHARYPQDPVLMEVATSYRKLADAEASGAAYMQKLGAKSLEELRALPTDKLMATPFDGGDHILDGYVMPHTYAETYKLGTQANVFVIAGFNKDETGASPETNYERAAARAAQAATQAAGGGPGPAFNAQATFGAGNYANNAAKRYGMLAIDFLNTLYPVKSDHDAFTQTSEAIRDNGRVSLWMWAQAWRVKATQPVYLYYWTHAPPGPNHDFSGAYHGSEISYAYNHPKAGEPWTADDAKIADTVSSYWVNFAKTGDPNGPGLPRWAPFDGKTEQVMELGDHFGPIPLTTPAKVDFWKRFYATKPAG